MTATQVIPNVMLSTHRALDKVLCTGLAHRALRTYFAVCVVCKVVFDVFLSVQCVAVFAILCVQVLQQRQYIPAVVGLKETSISIRPCTFHSQIYFLILIDAQLAKRVDVRRVNVSVLDVRGRDTQGTEHFYFSLGVNEMIPVHSLSRLVPVSVFIGPFHHSSQIIAIMVVNPVHDFYGLFVERGLMQQGTGFEKVIFSHL